MARPARNLDLHGSVPDTSTVAVVPSDCAIAIEPADHRQALRQMRRFFDADTRASTRLNLRRLAMRLRGRRPRGRR